MEDKKNSTYSEEEKKRGRRLFITFSLINTIAFGLLAGNVILLFLMRMGVNNTVIGAASSFMYVGYFVMPLGKKIADKYGVVKVFAGFWLARFIFISPLIFAPILARHSMPAAAVFTVLAFLAFQTLRGFGIVGLSPVMREISEGPDRGRFMSFSRIITDIGMLITGLTVAFLLGNNAPLERFQVFFTLGVILGICGSLLALRIPEPPGQQQSTPISLISSMKEIWSNKALRSFFIMLTISIFSIAMFRPYMILHAKRVYLLGDNFTIFLTVVGGLGSILGSFISKHHIDHHGAKPMISFFISVIIIVALSIAILPPVTNLVENHPIFWLYLLLLFFFGMMGFFGIQGTAQIYFFTLIDSKQQLNMGVLYFFIQGFAGLAGGSLGGLLGDILEQNMAQPPTVSHKVIFSIVAVFLLFSLFLAGKLQALGANSFKHLLTDIKDSVVTGEIWRGRPIR